MSGLGQDARSVAILDSNANKPDMCRAYLIYFPAQNYTSNIVSLLTAHRTATELVGILCRLKSSKIV